MRPRLSPGSGNGRGVSDTILRLHAADPDYRQMLRRRRVRDVPRSPCSPDADQIDVELYPNVTLIDCGENLRRIVCPQCGAMIGRVVGRVGG